MTYRNLSNDPDFLRLVETLRQTIDDDTTSASSLHGALEYAAIIEADLSARAAIVSGLRLRGSPRLLDFVRTPDGDT